MGALFGLLHSRVVSQAQETVNAYEREVAEYRPLMKDRRVRGEMHEFAVFIRRRVIDLAQRDRALTNDDLRMISAVGARRARDGMSLPALRHGLVLHTTRLLREIQDAAGPRDADDLFRVIGWFGPQAVAAGNAYVAGYLDAITRVSSEAARVRTVTGMLLADEPGAADLARGMGLPVSGRVDVVVVRIPEPPPQREEVVAALLKRYPLPMTWHEPAEFVLLVPAGDDRALAVVRDLAALTGKPCCAGTTTARVGGLAESVATARQISRVAPVEALPSQVYTLPDLFVELGIAALPPVRHWLHNLSHRLSAGTELVSTLHAYYRNDLNRLHTAKSLGIHPRTLDYRLQRVLELTGLRPGSTRGVRILSAAAACALAETRG